MPRQPMKDRMINGAFDDLYTPPEAIYPLIPYLGRKKVIWECCNGTGNISKILTEKHAMITTDINRGYDFFVYTPNINYDIIVTNPPYSEKDKFIERCFELGKPWAMLLPLDALSGIKRGSMYRKYGSVEALILDKRIDFTGKKAPWFNSVWLCHKLLPEKLIFAEVK